MASGAPSDVMGLAASGEGRVAQVLRNEEVEMGRQLKDLGALRAFDREVREGFSLQGPLQLAMKPDQTLAA